MIIACCSLCPMELPDESIRKLHHEDWHKYARRDNRNTTNGIVEWSFRYIIDIE